jgi:sugar phosphate permease
LLSDGRAPDFKTKTQAKPCVPVGARGETILQRQAARFAVTADDGESRLYRKVIVRIIPFIFICYVLNYIDRVNVSFAKLQFQSDLNLTDASYGLGVGLFYVGYILFEVPSNLLLQKIGARKTITRIMCVGIHIRGHGVCFAAGAVLCRAHPAGRR